MNKIESNELVEGISKLMTEHNLSNKMIIDLEGDLYFPNLDDVVAVVKPRPIKTIYYLSEALYNSSIGNKLLNEDVTIGVFKLVKKSLVNNDYDLYIWKKIDMDIKELEKENKDGQKFEITYTLYMNVIDKNKESVIK